jgi:hypothetical protein
VLLAAAAQAVDVAACLSAAPPLPALPPFLELRASPGCGRGLFATTDLPPLTELFTDAALLWWPLEPCDDVGATIVGAGTRRPGLSVPAVAGALLNLVPWASSPPPPPPATLGELFTAACSLNALGLCVAEGPPRRVLPCIAPVAAMLNHSCAPNCSYEGGLVAGAPAARIFSEVPIAAGEELTISYVLRSLPREERRARLATGYGIRDCACARCLEPCEGAWVARCGGCGAPSALARGAAGGAGPPQPCTACGAQDGGGGTSAAARAAWLRAHRDARPAALLGLGGAPSPLLHVDDQDVFSLVYGGLGGLWVGRGPAAHAQSVGVVTAVCGSAALARAGRGAAFAGDVLLFAGHLCTLAYLEGAADGCGALRAAAGFYARARAALAATYGESDARVEMAARFLAVHAESRAELEAAEAARLARTADWCGRFPALSPDTLRRWCACELPEPKSPDEMAAALLSLKKLREISMRARKFALGIE